MRWTSTQVSSGTATLAVQSAGREDDPTVLLLGGATWSRDWWPDDLCAMLVEKGLRVVRYDPRDTGESTLSPPGAPDYDASDLVDDAVAVLDAAGVDRALVVGLSMGGGLAQALAATHASRVRALVLLCTAPADDVQRDLPPPTDAIMATFEQEPPAPDWSDRESVVAAVIRDERLYAGPGAFDEDLVRDMVGRTWERSASMASAANHFVVVEAGEPVDLSGIHAPAVVLHGSADPLFPLPHGEALAEALGAPLVVMAGVGHQLPPRGDWPLLVERVVALA